MSDDANLFGMTPTPKRQKAAPVPGGAVQQLIGQYCTLFAACFSGERPVITPRDGKALKDMVTQSGVEKVAQRLPLYVGMDDTYLRGEGYPLRLMPGAWNKLTARLQQQASAPPAVEAQRTADYLRKIRHG